jgi:hypothetical protein
MRLSDDHIGICRCRLRFVHVLPHICPKIVLHGDDIGVNFRDHACLDIFVAYEWVH